MENQTRKRTVGWVRDIRNTSGDSFFCVTGQEVRGGEPPPCPRGALSPDLPLAFMQIPKTHPIAPILGTFGWSQDAIQMTVAHAAPMSDKTPFQPTVERRQGTNLQEFQKQ